MPSQYPGAIDALNKTLTNDTVAQDLHPQHHDDLADAVMKVQTELGINPRGASASVKSRLDGLDAHSARHQAAGADALTGLVDATARTAVRLNSGSDIGTRRRLNFIPGAGISLSASDSSGAEEVALTIVNLTAGYVFNVKDYGAKGDNATDDTTAIQNAINAWLTAGKGMLFFPPGIYRVTTTLLISPAAANTGPSCAQGYGAYIDVRTTGTPGIQIRAASNTDFRHWAIRDLNFTSGGGTPSEMILIDDGSAGTARVYQWSLNNIGMETTGGGHGLHIKGTLQGVYEYQVRDVRIWNVPNTKYGIWYEGAGTGNSSAEFYYCNIRGGLNNIRIESAGQRGHIIGGTFLLAYHEAIYMKTFGSNLIHPHVELAWQADTALTDPHGAIYIEGWANCIGVEHYIDGNNCKYVYSLYTYNGTTNIINSAANPGGGRKMAYASNSGSGGVVNISGFGNGMVTKQAGAVVRYYDNPPGTELYYAENNSTLSVTGTTQAAPSVIMGGAAVNYDGEPVTLEFYTEMMSNAKIAADWWIDGVRGGSIFIHDPSGGWVSAKTREKITPSAGSHTISVRCYTDAGTRFIVNPRLKITKA